MGKIKSQDAVVFEPEKTDDFPLPNGINTQDVKTVFLTLLDYKNRSEELQFEREKLAAFTKLTAKKMKRQYDLYEFVVTEIFKGRDKAIKKTFEVIDAGMKENDLQKINLGLLALSNIVTKSPFGDIDKFNKMIESGNDIVI